MPDLKCPYCPELRPTRAMLTTHVDNEHSAVNASMRLHDVNNARVVTGPLCGECGDPDATYENPKGQTFCAICAEGNSAVVPEPKREAPCVCGAPLVLIDADTDYPAWVHDGFSGKCPEAVPAAGMPTKPERDDLAARMSAQTEKIRAAGREMRAMREALDSIDARWAAMDAALTSPATVRRATLNQVWHRLFDANQMVAASLVMNMINSTGDDDA